PRARHSRSRRRARHARDRAASERALSVRDRDAGRAGERPGRAGSLASHATGLGLLGGRGLDGVRDGAARDRRARSPSGMVRALSARPRGPPPRAGWATGTAARPAAGAGRNAASDDGDLDQPESAAKSAKNADAVPPADDISAEPPPDGDPAGLPQAKRAGAP